MKCAIYTRKSTEEGLEQEFNSLDAQRECGEAFIKSQGWECLPERYDDGGFSGGNTERPALKRLMADVRAGRINTVVIYKLDRLSRSLLDFCKLVEEFDRHNVAFVAVTQQINTSSSMGRLMLNVLLSFAQFEREIITERTRDKIAAARRKGKWSGGMPILGYDVEDMKLVVDEEEAAKVRTIFNLYLEHQSLLAVVAELDSRGWVNKRWTTRKGVERGGLGFTKTSLHKILTNVTYTGKLRYKTEVHEGEHEGIVQPEVWQRVQGLMASHGRTGGAEVRNKFGALLKGILRCSACDCAMSPSHTTKKKKNRYRYYVCTSAQKRGWHTCPSKSIPAEEIEQFVVEQIRCIGRDPNLVVETVDHAARLVKEQIAALEAEKRALERQVKKGGAQAETRLTEVKERIAATSVIDQRDVARALRAFGPLWASLTPREKTRVIQLLVARVDYNGETGKVAVTFHASGIKSLAGEAA